MHQSLHAHEGRLWTDQNVPLSWTRSGGDPPPRVGLYNKSGGIWRACQSRRRYVGISLGIFLTSLSGTTPPIEPARGRMSGGCGSLMVTRSRCLSDLDRIVAVVHVRAFGRAVVVTLT